MKSLFWKMGIATFALIGLVVYDNWNVWTTKAETTATAVSSEIEHVVKSSLPTEPPAVVTTTVYKWKDAQGRWHFGAEPPPGVKNVEKETYNNDANVMQRLRAEDLAVLDRKKNEEPAKPKGVFTGLVNAAQQAQTAQEVMRAHHNQTQQQLDATR